jgi:hypothetical protein
MRRHLLVTALTVLCVTAAAGQGVPHDFTQDTPPVPGQIIEPQREKLRLAPLPLRDARDAHEIALPSSGPKGVVRETRNERKYAPPADR